MHRFNLKLRLALMALLPFLFFLGVGIFNANKTFQSYLQAKKEIHEIKIFTAVSALIHQSQIERGLSSGFLNGAVSENDYDTQIQKTTEALNQFVQIPSLPEHKMSLQIYTELRNDVRSKKITTPESIAKYT